MKMVNGVWLPNADTYFEKALDPFGHFQAKHLYLALEKHYGQQRRVALDIGAHVGTWSLILADTFDQVLAFEPARDTYDCLLVNVAKHGNIRPFNLAVGDQLATVSVNDDPTRPGNTGSRFISPAVPFAPWVHQLTIDWLLSGHPEQPRCVDFIKIDVEGNELAVLKGGQGSFLKYKPTVIMEVKDLGRGVDPELAAQYLLSLGAREVARIGKDRIYRW